VNWFLLIVCRNVLQVYDFVRCDEFFFPPLLFVFCFYSYKPSFFFLEKGITWKGRYRV